MRRALEKAKLQDQNLTLTEKTQRQQASLNAHSRFSARAQEQRSTLSTELNEMSSALSTMESKCNSTQSELEIALLKSHKQQEHIAQLEEKNKTQYIAHTSEISKQSIEWEQERKLLLTKLSQQSYQLKKMSFLSSTLYKNAKATSSTTSLKPTIEKLRLELNQSQVILSHKHEELKTVNEKLESNQTTIMNFQREMKIKDKQLFHLRGQLEDMTKTGGPSSFLDLAAYSRVSGPGQSDVTQGSTSKEDALQEFIEILEEDMKSMKLSYETKVKMLKLEIEDRRR